HCSRGLRVLGVVNHGAPRLAFAAAPNPLDAGPAALGAAVVGCGAGHAPSLGLTAVRGADRRPACVLNSSPEPCPSGRRCNSRKVVWVLSPPWVQIPPVPPNQARQSHLRQVRTSFNYL